MTNYVLNLSDSIVSTDIPISENFDFSQIEEVIGSMLTPYFGVYYIEDQKAIQIDLTIFTAVVFQKDENIEWIGYNGMQNLRHSEIEADIRTMNGQVNYQGNVYDSTVLASQIIDLVQELNTKNITINGDPVIFVKLKSAENLAVQQRGEDWMEFIFQIDVLTNNF